MLRLASMSNKETKIVSLFDTLDPVTMEQMGKPVCKKAISRKPCMPYIYKHIYIYIYRYTYA